MIFRGHLDFPPPSRRTTLADVYERAAFLALEVEDSLNVTVVEARAIAAAVAELVSYELPAEFEAFREEMEFRADDPVAAGDAAHEAFPLERYLQRHSPHAGVKNFHWPWDGAPLRASRNLAKAAERERSALVPLS